MFLPLVKEEIGYSVAESMGNEDERVYIKKELKKIKKDNPVVADFIIRWSKMAKTKHSKIHSAYCGILLYGLLESQAEVDYMEKEINLL